MSPVITKARFMDGLVLWLPMTEGAGTVVKDLSKYGNNGTFGAGAAAPSWVAGRDGLPSVSFDGSDSILVADAPSLNFGASTSFTLALWFRTSDSGNIMWLVAKGEAFGQSIYGIRKNTSNKLEVRIYDATPNGVVLESDAVVNDGVRHHLVVVVDRSTDLATYYIDKIIQAAQGDLSSVGDIDSGNDFTIGKHPSPGQALQYWDDLFDSICAYNRTLDPYEVRALYEAVRRI